MAIKTVKNGEEMNGNTLKAIAIICVTLCFIVGMFVFNDFAFHYLKYVAECGD